MPRTAERLRATLGALPLVIETADAALDAIAVPSYPDEPRPHSIVTLRGDGTAGQGEHVGWTAAAHRACRDDALPRVPRGRWTLAAWSAALASVIGDPYDRAALEAAAIDLALRQRDTDLFRLAAIEPRPLRYVVSFARVADPVAIARAEGDVELKVDADPTWADATLAALAATGRVAVLDWKNAGTRVDHERAHRLVPEALQEDPCWALAPWSPALQHRLSADVPLLRADDVHRLPVRPAAANLKPARMGGVLEMLAAAAACEARGIAVYVGGMFEIDLGRRQLQALAALLSPDGPNDVAPIARQGEVADRPTRLTVAPAATGFGAEPGA